MVIALRYAARSDVGLVRSTNQDSGYAGPSLLVIADGMGGHAGGDVASSLAIDEMAPLDDDTHRVDTVLNQLSEAVLSVHRDLLHRVAAEPRLSGMGTTVTALLKSGGRLALAHLGDSRAYHLRDGRLAQITRDHTFVQHLVDDGEITLAQAEQHPHRSVLLRALSDVMDDVTPDLSMREARLGDRYLLCSDGLSGVLSFETIQATLADGTDPGAICERLVELALHGGAPDNVTCIVADVVDAAGTRFTTLPVVVGAASMHQESRSSGKSTAERASQLPGAAGAIGSTPETDPTPQGRKSRRIARSGLAAIAVVVLLGAGGGSAYRWSQNQFFVGGSKGSVAVFRGLPQRLGPITLSHLASPAPDVLLADLPTFTRNQVEQGIVTDDEASAESVVQRLRIEATTCRAADRRPAPGITGAPTPDVTSSGPAASTPPVTDPATSTIAPTATSSSSGASSGAC
jgi:protein phosphatase